MLPVLLSSFDHQTDKNFKLLLINNNSIDKSVAIIKRFRLSSSLQIEIINESQQGTGAAVDTGSRYAISKGAKCVARADADAILEKNWVRALRRRLNGGYKLVFGGLHFRKDENTSRLMQVATKIFFYTAEMLGNLSFDLKNKHRHYIVLGGNMAFTSDIYISAGGFPRNSLKDPIKTEDCILANSIRKLTNKVIRDPDMICYYSLRRINRYGLFRSTVWYWLRINILPEVDVR